MSSDLGAFVASLTLSAIAREHRSDAGPVWQIHLAVLKAVQQQCLSTALLQVLSVRLVFETDHTILQVRIVKEDGAIGLFRGAGPTVVRAMALNMGMLASNDEACSQSPEDHTIQAHHSLDPAAAASSASAQWSLLIY